MESPQAGPTSIRPSKLVRTIGKCFLISAAGLRRTTKRFILAFSRKSPEKKVTEFGSEHNFVWRRSRPEKGYLFLYGRGATALWTDEEDRTLLCLIQLNMAAPILITVAPENSEFLGFAPHGAGRNQSRTATLRQFRKTNGDVDEASIQKAIDEATKSLDIR